MFIIKVDLKDVPGTGKEGRVLKEDILNYVNIKKSIQPPAPISRPTATADAAPSAKVQTTVSPSGAEAILKTLPVYAPLPDRKEPVKGYIKAMVKSMTIANVILNHITPNYFC